MNTNDAIKILKGTVKNIQINVKDNIQISDEEHQYINEKYTTSYG